jgi:hypothetical protein
MANGEIGKEYNLPHLEFSTLAYKTARKYAEHNAIKIYNSTRGGKLEVFERVNFDAIINNDKLSKEKYLAFNSITPPPPIISRYKKQRINVKIDFRNRK